MNENQKITFIKDLGMRFPTATSVKKRRYSLCLCNKCGNEFEIMTMNIKKTVSCGCNKFSHRLSKHRLYSVWYDMMSRCYNKNNFEYKRYGAIGIIVAKEWHDIKTFVEDMYPTFKEGLTLDKDKLCKEKGIYPHIYSKYTCCWATKTEQSRITRKLSATNTSGYRGVIFIKKIDKFRANVKIYNKNIYLGYHNTALEAAKARDKYIIDDNLEHTLNDVL